MVVGLLESVALDFAADEVFVEVEEVEEIEERMKVEEV